MRAPHAAPEEPAGTSPPVVAVDREGMIRDGLRSLNLSGSIFLRAELSAPWAYVSPDAEEVGRLFGVPGSHIIIFHVIMAGSCRIELGNGLGTDLEAGDIAIMPFSDQHRMGNPSVATAVPLRQILPDANSTELHYGGGGPTMSMVCGYLRCDDVLFNPVLASLPPLVRVPTAGGPLGHWVEASLKYAMNTLGRQRLEDDPLLQRLPELMFIECLCDFATRELGTERGWLAGLADPVVGRALACMHREPEQPWTLKELAKRAATSRTVLDERFRQLLGQAPMSYLTAWRLQLASRRLRTSAATMAEVAGAVGYGSEASFSRAFKRLVGVSPSEWRNAG